MSKDAIRQHKRMAMGQDTPQGSGGKFANGGSVGLLKTGIPTGPLSDAKRANGVKGYKDGGSVKMPTSMQRKSAC